MSAEKIGGIIKHLKANIEKPGIYGPKTDLEFQRWLENSTVFEEFLAAAGLRRMFGGIIRTQRLKGAEVHDSIYESNVDPGIMRLELTWPGAIRVQLERGSAHSVVVPDGGSNKISVVFREVGNRVSIKGERVELDFRPEDVSSKDFEPPMQEQIAEAVARAFISPEWVSPTVQVPQD